MSPMTRLEMAIRAAIYHLKSGPITCSNLGAQMWGNGYKKPQSFARPAGKLLREMERRGMVHSYFDDFHRHFMWRLKIGYEKGLRES